MINLAPIVVMPRTSQVFTVYRTTGRFIGGRWVNENLKVISMRGTVSVSSPKELVQVPEGDRTKVSMVFHSREPIYTTREEGEESGVSDKILWNDEFYKVYRVSPYKDYGYYRAEAERLKGH